MWRRNNVELGYEIDNAISYEMLRHSTTSRVARISPPPSSATACLYAPGEVE